MDLLDFQMAASNQIADRVVEYMNAPLFVGRSGQQRKIPYIQLLNAITASGKTLILADSVSSIAKQMPIKPVVLWLSKASVVVAQSYAKLDAGGVYHELLQDVTVHTLADYDESELISNADCFLFFATVGTFNQEKMSQSSLNVFKSAIDEATGSTWDSLKIRPGQKGIRRPLIVVYDEAHNLSDQQTSLLLQLEPDAFLLATATSRLPAQFQNEVIDHLTKSAGISEEMLSTTVSSSQVAASGLIKNTLSLVGRQAPMEAVISEMWTEMNLTTKAARQAGLAETPKAVYVCKTNISEDSGAKDDPKIAFSKRQAPPILIWRHLTEKLRVDPREIVAYCDLKIDKNFPLPKEFILLRGGDKDYDRFVSGGFRHIIFNQSLQEGWDDPYLYFAYIDKSVSSRVQAEQIVGRLLRQPERKLYQAQRLNRAEIFVRVEKIGVFDEVVGAVEEKLSTGRLDIKVITTKPGRKLQEEIAPRKSLTVPVPAILTDRAEKRIAEHISNLTDYRNDDGTNTRGKGKRASVQRIVGSESGPQFSWEDYGESASVQARWLFARELSRVHKGALGVAVTAGSDPTLRKFDAKIGLGSAAAIHVADTARKVGDAFIDQIYLKLRGPNPYEVGPVMVTREGLHLFKHSLHKGYDAEEFNSFEIKFAKVLDKTKLAWCRNPSRSGYSIPLLEPGKTIQFFPDFLVWKKNDVFAIDTKGSHLHADAARKLVAIKPSNDSKIRVFVRFISDGVVDAKGPQPDSTGFTVWSFKPSGAPEFSHYDLLPDALEASLRADV